MYSDVEYDFAVLELGFHDSDVPFPPALTYFGRVCCTEVYLVGHPNLGQLIMQELIPFWLPEHKDIIKPYIDRIGTWSTSFFPDGRDYYEHLPRKIMFYTTFNHGSSGSPGVMIRDDEPCVVLMVRARVVDHQNLVFGYAMEDIDKKMRNSPLDKVRNLASEVFKIWKS